MHKYQEIEYVYRKTINEDHCIHQVGATMKYAQAQKYTIPLHPCLCEKNWQFKKKEAGRRLMIHIKCAPIQ